MRRHKFASPSRRYWARSLNRLAACPGYRCLSPLRRISAVFEYGVLPECGRLRVGSGENVDHSGVIDSRAAWSGPVKRSAAAAAMASESTRTSIWRRGRAGGGCCRPCSARSPGTARGRGRRRRGRRRAPRPSRWWPSARARPAARRCRGRRRPAESRGAAHRTVKGEQDPGAVVDATGGDGVVVDGRLHGGQPAVTDRQGLAGVDEVDAVHRDRRRRQAHDADAEERCDHPQVGMASRSLTREPM